MSASFHIVPVRTPEDLEATIALFYAYADFLGVDLTYQKFKEEMAVMPGKYAPPQGELLLARDENGIALGCVGLRPLGGGACEMKRLYVTPEARGLGLGKALAEAIVAHARSVGYKKMLLDTLPKLKAAVALYKDMGFRRTAAYYDTPIVGTMFFVLEL